MDKRTLRQEIKEINKTLSAEYKKNSSENIYTILTDSMFYKNAQNIFVYISSPSEPDTKKIIETALSGNKNIFVPKCISDSDMIAVQINTETKMIKGYKGLTEPAIIPQENTENTHFDLCIIPCVSASTDGKRLGHGAGFYDRFLQNRETLKICLCFDKQLSSYIPESKYDIRMDAVITENGIFFK